MTNIIMPGAPYCPLCDQRMREVHTNKGVVYCCFQDDCMVSINAADPVVGQWFKMENPPVCPKDGTNMRVFFRSGDKFIKAQCPTCRKQGKMTQVMVGKVEHMDPRWSADV